MSNTPAEARSSAARTRRHRERRRQGTRVVALEVNKGEIDALIVRGYLAEEARGDLLAIKNGIENLLSDLVFEVEFEATPGRPRVWARESPIETHHSLRSYSAWHA
jgi:hypothetical protein